ncbi:MAG TPA: ABC transporter substrate-binding protein, partial [Xanthobacteraceae bacterium]|nr:ABC transporter substrate-binding protein [Xanthobacteraceae bacterium]
MKRLGLVAAALGALLITSGARAQTVPAGYPANYNDIIAGAQKEGKLVIYASTDSASAEPILKGFGALYPFLKVEYNDLNSTELYNRFISEVAAGAGTADFLWSSAMDLQIKLVTDKNALAYESAETKNLPTWSVYEKQAYGTTLEPLVMVYNQRLLPADAVPKSHADLVRIGMEKTDLLKNKLTMYDIEKSGVGFMLVTQDIKAWPQFWDLATAFGKAGGKYYTSAGAMMEKVTSGEHLIASNIFGSYALLRQKKDPNLAIVYPSDYTLGMSRVAFISKGARNPNAAKLFLDYMLSKQGQDIIANQSLLYSIRDDVEGTATAATLKKQLGDKLTPIPVNASLLD